MAFVKCCYDKSIKWRFRLFQPLYLRQLSLMLYYSPHILLPILPHTSPIQSTPDLPTLVFLLNTILTLTNLSLG